MCTSLFCNSLFFFLFTAVTMSKPSFAPQGAGARAGTQPRSDAALAFFFRSLFAVSRRRSRQKCPTEDTQFELEADVVLPRFSHCNSHLSDASTPFLKKKSRFAKWFFYDNAPVELFENSRTEHFNRMLCAVLNKSSGERGWSKFDRWVRPTSAHISVRDETVLICWTWFKVDSISEEYEIDFLAASCWLFERPIMYLFFGPFSARWRKNSNLS